MKAVIAIERYVVLTCESRKINNTYIILYTYYYTSR